MDTILPGIFSLLVGIAGWYYMFYSSAATKLARIERDDVNRVRVLLRRLGGLMMICLAAAFYVGSIALQNGQAVIALVCLGSVCLLLCFVVALGVIDLKLTRRLRRGRDE